MKAAGHLFLATVASILFAFSCGCGGGDLTRAEAAAAPATNSDPASELQAVTVVRPEHRTLRRTTTQPATAHAWHEAQIYAKVAGYLKELKADLGDEVDAGAVLAVISVPELQKQVEKQQATVRSLESKEKQAAAGVTVAEANHRSADALLNQARADTGRTDALLAADAAEMRRVTDLVQRRAVADRLLDEARKRHDSSQAARQSAEAAVVSAQANRSVAEARIEAARADREAAEAETDIARRELEELQALQEYTTLNAPFHGVVTQRNVDPGDLVRNIQTASDPSRQPLFCIAQLDKLRVRVPVPENDAPGVNPGDKATLVLRALRGRPIEAQVARVARSLDPGTRTMLAEIDVPNPDGSLLPGMYAEATIVLEERADAILLPARAVRHDEQGRSYVYAVQPDDTIRIIDVVTGSDDGHHIEITSGLAGDERIVDAQIGRLKDGQKVRVQQ